MGAVRKTTALPQGTEARSNPEMGISLAPQATAISRVHAS